jgi:hypothetical protein
MPEATEREKSNYTMRKALVKLKRRIGALYVVASVALLIILLTVVPLNVEYTMDMYNIICDDRRNADAFSAWASDSQFTNANEPDAQEMAMVLKNLFRMNPVTITIVWGSFTFPAVKSIDTAWNLVISRLGQMTFGIFTGKVITAWLVRKMESERVPYQLFRETALPRGCSLVILWYLCNTKRCSTLWKRHKLQLLGFAVCVSFVMIHPILTDAMTGYTVRRTPYYKGLNGDVLVVDEEREDGRLLYVDFSIDNGHLLNLSDPTYVWKSGGRRGGLFESGFSPPKITTFQSEAFNSEVYRCASIFL